MEAAENDTTAIARRSPTAHILVIEDEVHIRELLDTVLTRAGHRVRAAPDGLAGLEHALADPPGLIVLDVIMPRLDGITVAKRLRAAPATATTPILMLTGLDHALDRALDAGVDDFLPKPVEIAEFEIRIAALLAARDAMGGGDPLQRALAYVRALEAVRHPDGR